MVSRQNSRPGDVVAFLRELELGHVEDLFRTSGVDGDMLVDRSEDDMQAELGLTKLQARKVKKKHIGRREAGSA